MALQTVAAICADFKCVCSHDPRLAARIAPEPDFAAGDCFIQQLQVPALRQAAADIDGCFATGDVVRPVPGTEQHENNE